MGSCAGTPERANTFEPNKGVRVDTKKMLQVFGCVYVAYLHHLLSLA